MPSGWSRPIRRRSRKAIHRLLIPPKSGWTRSRGLEDAPNQGAPLIQFREPQTAETFPGHRDDAGPIRRKCNFSACRRDDFDRRLLDPKPARRANPNQTTPRPECPDRPLEEFESSAQQEVDIAPRTYRPREYRAEWGA